MLSVALRRTVSSAQRWLRAIPARSATCDKGIPLSCATSRTRRARTASRSPAFPAFATLTASGLLRVRLPCIKSNRSF